MGDDGIVETPASGVMDHEPVAATGFATAFVVALIALVTSFGLDLSTAQRDAIIGIVPFLVAAGTWITSRPHITPWRDGNPRHIAPR